MSDPIDHWASMAEIWEFFEHYGMKDADLQDLHADISSPALLIGAGQGLLLEKLKELGIEAYGIDSSPTMIARGRERRGAKITLASGESIPFAAATFQTVIIATGVLDGESKTSNVRVLSESLRVLDNDGTLIAGFGFANSHALTAGQAIGSLQGRTQRFGCLVDLWRAAGQPDQTVAAIAKWTGQSLSEAEHVATLYQEDIAGVKLFLDDIAEHLASEGKDPHSLFAECMTVSETLFTEAGVRELFAECDLQLCQLIRKEEWGVLLGVTRR